MNKKAIVKVGKRLVEAHLDVDLFKKCFTNNFDLVEAFNNALIIVEAGTYGEQEIRDVILAETEWLPFFIKINNYNFNKVIFIVATVEYENVPQITSGNRTKRFNEFEMPISFISRKDDVIVLNNVIDNNADMAHNFLKNRTVDFNGEQWVIKNS